MHEIQTLSEDWYVLKKTRFSFRRTDGAWQEQWRETYDRGNGATILLYDPDRRTVILTRQFRYPAFVNGHDDLLIEAPAGLLDNAQPEERIPCGGRGRDRLSGRRGPTSIRAFMSPGSVTERLYFFVAPYYSASRVGNGGGNAQEGEDIGVIEIAIEEALGMIERGEDPRRQDDHPAPIRRPTLIRQTLGRGRLTGYSNQRKRSKSKRFLSPNSMPSFSSKRCCNLSPPLRERL